MRAQNLGNMPVMRAAGLAGSWSLRSCRLGAAPHSTPFREYLPKIRRAEREAPHGTPLDTPAEQIHQDSLETWVST